MYLNAERLTMVCVWGDGLGRSGCRRGTRKTSQDLTRAEDGSVMVMVCVLLRRRTPPAYLLVANAVERISAGRGGHKGGHRDTPRPEKLEEDLLAVAAVSTF